VAFSCIFSLLAETQIPEPISQDILLVAMETEKIDGKEADGNLP